MTHSDGRKSVLVIGDVMLDSFIYGTVARISPEAATPILNATREDRMVGGAANVARGVAALGPHCVLISVTGVDKWADEIKRECEAFGIEPIFEPDATRQTTRKVRLVSAEHSSHLLRLDYEDTHCISDAITHKLIERMLAVLNRVEAVVISDYGKGCLSPILIRAVIDTATSQFQLPVLVDPKAKDPSIYRGATMIKPNRYEIGRDCKTEQEFIEAATAYGAKAQVKSVLITRGEQGMTLYRRAAKPIHVPAHRVPVRDVSGAGDTVLAAVAASMACGMPLAAAVRFANDAAAIAVSKPGTAAVTRAEISAPKWKICPIDDYGLLDQRLAEWRLAGLRIGFANGCFDLLHPGHVALLTTARTMCDRLIVALNSDSSVRFLKGAPRPILPWEARADVVSAIEGVDLVVGFETPEPRELIERVRPTTIFKGNDYAAASVCGADIAAVKILPRVGDHSTTKLISEMVK